MISPNQLTPIYVLGVDLALRNLGLALLRVTLRESRVELLDVKLISTENEKGKVVRQNSDDLRRARELLAAVQEWEARATVVSAEIPTGAQSARAALGFGMAIGILASIKKPLIQVQPTEVKKCVTGRKTASKDEMIVWARARYPDAEWLMRKLHGEMIPTDANEHIADAVAIGHTGMKTDQFRGMIQLMAA